MVIHKEGRIAPDNIPEGSLFKGCNPYVVRGLQIVPFNTRYLLEQWLTPEGKIVSGQLPSNVDGHFDSVLKSFVIYQYHHCHVTQPLILEQLREWDIGISAGQINRILNEGKEIVTSQKVMVNDILSFAQHLAKIFYQGQCALSG